MKPVCSFVVAYAGDLNRGERLPIGVLAWDRESPPEGLVHQSLLKYWGRFEALYPKRDPEYYRDIISRLQAIKTVADYCRILDKMGPYTPFEFTEERAYVGSQPNEVAESMGKWFFEPYSGSCSNLIMGFYSI